MSLSDSPLPSPRPLSEIVQGLQLDATAVEPYGWYAGKLELNCIQQLQDRPNGCYVGVTAVSPTPFGEGKTVVAIGLAMALQRLGKRTIVNLRQPSLAPVFGIKGGGAGGGRASLLPADQINLHFTGDLHAVAAANNLLAAMLDNHAKRRLTPQVDISGISWRRVLDMNDKGLARIESGLDDPIQAPRRETGFDLTAASEVMSVLALATDPADLRNRMGRIVVARSVAGDYITADDIGAGGAMTALVINAFRPNLVQTCEHSPAFVHAGPFANISHGNSSVVADLAALRLAEYVVTESGFGADLGAEKLFNIKCRASGIRPNAEVLVCTVRALKYQSGRFDVRPGRPLPDELIRENVDALTEGSSNLLGHLDILRKFGLPAVVAINRFPTDSDREIETLQRIAMDAGASKTAVADVFARGSEGALELAEAVIAIASQPNHFQLLYPSEATLEDKLRSLACHIYGAEDVEFETGVREKLKEFTDRGYGHLPVCVAKTQYSLSHDPKLNGRPRGFRFPVRDVRLAAGAGFVLAMAEGISLLPGLPRNPAARRIDVDPNGKILGLH